MCGCDDKTVFASPARLTGVLAAITALALVACADDDRAVAEPSDFPDGFLFGSATAGFQVEMGCPTLPSEQCVDANSDWYAYVTDPAIRSIDRTALDDAGDPAVVGPGHWELFEADYDLAAGSLRNNAFRMSIEWSRIFPEPTDGIESHEALRAVADREALEHYRTMLESMQARGLTPLVNLHHYTLPLWIHDAVTCTLDFAECTERGWLDRERIAREMAKYAGFVARELGNLVDLWATQNEPFAVLMTGYLLQNEERSNPPARMLDAPSALAVLEAMVEAHARTVDAVRENDTVDADGDGVSAQLGFVHAMAPALPADPDNSLDVQAAENVFYLWNLVMLDAAALGDVDEDLDGTQTHRDDLAGRLDWIGLNYKQSIVVQGLEFSLLPQLSPLLTLNPVSIDLSQIHPRGLYEMVHFLDQRYGLPIYVTENNGRQMWLGDEAAEARYVVENLQWLAQAIRDGVDVRGYFYWAFMDNYEWNRGMSIGLGLFAVNPDDPTKARVPRALVDVYADIAATGRISDELRAQYPVDLDQPPTGGVGTFLRN